MYMNAYASPSGNQFITRRKRKFAECSGAASIIGRLHTSTAREINHAEGSRTQKIDPFFFRCDFDGIDRAFDRCARGNFFEVDRITTCFETRQIEQLGDQARQPLRMALERTEEFACALRIVEPAAAERFDGRADDAD